MLGPRAVSLFLIALMAARKTNGGIRINPMPPLKKKDTVS